MAQIIMTRELREEQPKEYQSIPLADKPPTFSICNFAAEPNGFSDDFLEYTKKVWEPVLRKEITIEEAREIAENLISLELYLRELKKKYG